MAAPPSTNEAKRPERGPDGRFLPGNAGGPGNPHGGQVAKLRAALLSAVTPADMRAIVRALVQKARGGDVAAARELLDRLFGRAAVVVEDVAATPGNEPIGRVEFYVYNPGTSPCDGATERDGSTEAGAE